MILPTCILSTGQPSNPTRGNALSKGQRKIASSVLVLLERIAQVLRFRSEGSPRGVASDAYEESTHEGEDWVHRGVICEQHRGRVIQGLHGLKRNGASTQAGRRAAGTDFRGGAVDEGK